MIDRYRVAEIENFWNRKHRFALSWQVEKDVCEALYNTGVMPKHDWERIRNFGMKIDLATIDALEDQYHHETVALTRFFEQQIDHPAARWIHYGLTSSDILDTVQNYIIKKSNQLVLQAVTELAELLKKQALLYKHQLIMGRTHGMHAEPTSLGLKFLLWFKEVDRWEQLFQVVKNNVEVAKISGSLGNYAHVSPEIERHVAKKLNLALDGCSTQVTQRDRHASLLSAFAALASTLEKMAMEFRHWQMSGVKEISEGQMRNQKGSSSMPHKKNPISAENICGLARLIRSFPDVAYQNNLLWQERDMSHSSNERIIFPQVYHLVIYILRRMINLIKNMVVDAKAIMSNITASHQIFYGQLIMTYILGHHAVPRAKIYDLVQKVNLKALAENKDLLPLVKASKLMEYITEQELDKLCQLNYFVRNVDKIYKWNKL